MSAALLSVYVGEMLVATLVWVAFPIHYHLTTRGRWAATAHGRNVMTLAVILSLMLAFTVGSLVLPTALVFWVALILMPALALVGVRYHLLLWRDQRSKREVAP